MLFRYSALTNGHATIEGLQEAGSTEEVALRLRRQGLIPLRIAPDKKGLTLRNLLSTEIRFGPSVSPNDLAAILYELGGLLVAGVMLDEALHVIAEGRTKPALRGFVEGLRENVKSGASLADALARVPKEVPPEVIAIIRAGEAAGALGATVTRLAADLLHRRKQMAEFRKALAYPAILAFTALAVVLVLFLVVVPQLEGLFPEGAEDRLPLVAQIVIAASKVLREYGLVLAIGLGLLGMALALSFRIPAARRVADRTLLFAPVIGSLTRVQAIAQFLATFASLLQGGVKTERALGIAASIPRNGLLRDRLEVAHRNVVEGRTLSEVIARTNLFGQDVISIMRVGERTGQLAAMMARAASLYEERARDRLQFAIALIGPLLTALLGLIAAIVAYAVLSTLLSVNELAFQ
jgi:general secretion pathway protein F